MLGWTRDIGAGCLAALTAIPLAGFLIWMLGLSGWAGALVFGGAVGLISMLVELGFRDSSNPEPPPGGDGAQRRRLP